MNKSISDISGKLSTKEIQKETTKQNKYEEKTKNINVSLKFNDNKTNKDIIKKEKVSNTKILVKKKSEKKECFSCYRDDLGENKEVLSNIYDERIGISNYKKKEECDQAFKKSGEKLKENPIKIENLICLNKEYVKKDENNEEKNNNNIYEKNNNKLDEKDIIKSKENEPSVYFDESLLNKKLLSFGNELKEYIEKEIKEKINKSNNELNKRTNKVIKEAIEGANKEINKKMEKMEEKIKESNIKIGLLNLINNQSEKFLNIKLENMNYKMEKILNTYQILYLRKLTNFIIE